MENNSVRACFVKVKFSENMKWSGFSCRSTEQDQIYVKENAGNGLKKRAK